MKPNVKWSKREPPYPAKYQNVYVSCGGTFIGSKFLFRGKRVKIIKSSMYYGWTVIQDLDTKLYTDSYCNSEIGQLGKKID